MLVALEVTMRIPALRPRVIDQGTRASVRVLPPPRSGEVVEIGHPKSKSAVSAEKSVG